MNNLSDDATMEKLLYGRLYAVKIAPYYRRGLFSITVHETPGLQTFATDEHWRMYYDPEVVEQWTVPEIGAVWLHELEHLIRKHSQRFKATQDPINYARLWNISADAGINTDLKEMGVTLPQPESRYYSTTKHYPEWEKGKLTENLYEIAKKYENVDNSNDPEDTSSPPDSDDENSDRRENQDESGSDQTDNEQTNREEDSQEEDSQENKSSDNSGQNSSKGENSEENVGSEDSESNENDDSESFCGSGADGVPREYDLGEDDSDGSLDSYQSEKLREEIAHDILEQEKSSPGSVPGGMIREAEMILNPQVNWKREISRDLRMFASFWAGQDVSTYNRTSRRSRKDIIFPGKVAVKPPEIALVLDTSMSMSQKDLGFVLGEASAIMKRIKALSPIPKINVINCDVASADVIEATNVSQITLTGGGGTDMRVGIKTAAELRKTPDLIITATDGYTPFPKEPVAPALRTKYIVLLTVQGLVTDRVKRQFENIIPSFMKTIYVSVT